MKNTFLAAGTKISSIHEFVHRDSHRVLLYLKTEPIACDSVLKYIKFDVHREQPAVADFTVKQCNIPGRHPDYFPDAYKTRVYPIPPGLRAYRKL